jgi:hypothetical protein
MYPKPQIIAIGQILTITTIFCMFIRYSWCQPSDLSTSSSDNRKILYHQANKDRLSVQQTTKKFISISDQYEKCISKTATDESCTKSIEELKAKLKEILETHTKTAPATSLPQPNTIIDTEVNVTIQNNNFFPFPTPTRVIVPYQPPNSKPKNSFTPKPGFMPQNRFQAGDGFNQ